MLARPLKYARPASVAEATALLRSHPGARPLAGGQSIVNVLKLRAAEVDALIDISRLEELRTIAATPDGGLELGAGVRYVELASAPLVRERLPIVADVADGLVDVQVRNRGTLGGNICLNDPTSNFPPLLVALGATIRIAGAGAERRSVPAGDFFVGPYRCALEPGELVHSVVLAPLGGDEGVGYQTLQLARDSWALARAAVWLRRDGDAIADARVVLGCLGPRPARQGAIEAALLGGGGGEASVSAAVAAPLEGIDAVGDSHASPEYRVEMARVYAKRAIHQALAQTEAPA
ncbi:MAG: molybdopterin dehydrogenase FAD-binding protein [Conexibacter sp.]|nr:molybdopterin dehydrogenase FAD-binding protein [Conexibacter sp.]